MTKHRNVYVQSDMLSTLEQCNTLSSWLGAFQQLIENGVVGNPDQISSRCKAVKIAVYCSGYAKQKQQHIWGEGARQILAKTFGVEADAMLRWHKAITACLPPCAAVQNAVAALDGKKSGFGELVRFAMCKSMCKQACSSRW